MWQPTPILATNTSLASCPVFLFGFHLVSHSVNLTSVCLDLSVCVFVCVLLVAKDYNSRTLCAGGHMGLSYVVREPIIQGLFDARQMGGTASR